MIRLGILGVGRMGSSHARSVATSSRAALVALCDSDPEALRQAARLYSVPTFATLEDFLAMRMDGVVISSSTSAHADQVAACARAGLCIFTEKPVGLSMEASDHALSEVVRAGVHFQIGYQRRWDRRFQRMKSLIEAGDVGEPVYFKAHGRDPDASRSANWGLEKNGGLFLNCAIHDYDAARYLLGGEVQSISATGAVLVHEQLKAVPDLDTCISILSFRHGAMAVTEWLRFASYGYDVEAEVVGTEGIVRLSGGRQPGVEVRRRTTRGESARSFFAAAYTASIESFLEAIEQGSAATPGVEDARTSLQLALLARQSYESGSGSVRVPPLPPLPVGSV